MQSPRLFCLTFAGSLSRAECARFATVERTSDQQHPSDAPRFLWPACGALCDIFWWAPRESESVASPAPAAISPRKES